MSYIKSRIRCNECGHEMNVAFGIVGTQQTAGWPTKCPECGSMEFTQIEHGWQLNQPPSDSACQPEYIVPPTTAGGNETVVRGGIYVSRKPFSELRADMSPESQARAAAQTAEYLTEIDSVKASTTAEPVRPVGCPARFYDGLTPEQGLQVTRAFFAGMSAASMTARCAGCGADISLTHTCFPVLAPPPSSAPK